MKHRTTLTLDPTISHRAKLLARQRGVSLSSMVERLLAEETMVESAESDTSGFSIRWRGQMRLADQTKEPRYEKLRRKYGFGRKGG